MSNIRHVTLPEGFVAAGVKCGIKASGKHDLAIIAGDADVSAAVVTTQNQVIGEPVRYVRQVLPKGYGTIRGIVINSGCSNVCTGPAGLKDAKKMAALTARQLGTSAGKVLVASTGIIGHRLPMAKVAAGIADAASRLSRNNDSDALHAIMTTDTMDKCAAVQFRLGGKLVSIGGIIKGSGMIAPSMATMIGVITTDAAIAPQALYAALTGTVTNTFNAITVDSDTSTSDTVVVLASGAAGNKKITADTKDFAVFAKALHEVCGVLARAVVVDGEGATKLVEITVRGARNQADAFIAGKSVANSPLFKTAIHGGDPNWGRISAALGKSSAKVDPQKLTIAIGGTAIFARGTGKKFNLKKVESHLKGKVVQVDCNLGLGKGQALVLTCDLSREYIAINADYST